MPADGTSTQIEDLSVRFDGNLQSRGTGSPRNVARALNEGGNPAHFVLRARIREMEPAIA